VICTKRDHLVSLLEQGLNAFRPQFNAAMRETRFGATDAWLKADSNKLSQVIRNLLQNALQYTEPGGTFRISVEQTVGRIKVIFVNSGCELGEQDLPFIFERFYRGEVTVS
jgi:signal transduction histidine kinase